MKRQTGFTLVELMVTVVIVGILAGVSLVAYNQIQKDARDNTRQSTAALISTALEKYYQKNGEYPAPSALSASSGISINTAATKLGINPADITMPRITAGTNPIITTAGTPGSGFITYDTTGCQGGSTGGCESYTLRYINDSGVVISTGSRRSGTPGS